MVPLIFKKKIKIIVNYALIISIYIYYFKLANVGHTCQYICPLTPPLISYLIFKTSKQKEEVFVTFLPYSIFQTSKQEKCVTILPHSPLIPPLPSTLIFLRISNHSIKGPCRILEPMCRMGPHQTTSKRAFNW